MALFECPRCGTRLAYASKDHPCKGGVSADKMQEAREQAPHLEKGSTPLPSTKPKHPTHKIIEGLKEAIAVASGEVEPVRVTIVKVGRPKKTEKQPWEVEGITRATWYRNQRRQKEGKL
jgi:hypothetical protein